MPQQTRQVIASAPDGQSGWVIKEIRVGADQWIKTGVVRQATAEEIRSGRVADTAPAAPATDEWGDPLAEGADESAPVAEAPVNLGATAKESASEPALSGSHNAHARLAPSASKQWTKCTASLAYIEANRHRVPEDTGSRYAEEGTKAHDYAAAVLTGKMAPSEIPDGAESRDPDFPDSDFRTPVTAYVEHCLALVPEGKKPEVEVSVPLFYQPEQSGTCDFAMVAQDRVVVRDYKHGVGVLVRSEENTQLAIYTLSLVRDYDLLYNFGPDTGIDMAVFQPRHHEGAEQAPWVTTLADLEAFCKDIEYRAIQARTAVDRVQEKLNCGGRDFTAKEILEAAPGAKFAPGEGDDSPCRWCDARGFCDARAAHCIEPMAPFVRDPVEFISAMPSEDDPEGATPEERLLTTLDGPLSDETLVGFYRSWGRLKAFFSDVADYLAQRAEEGRPAQGTKLVLGREGNREWADEDAAETFDVLVIRTPTSLPYASVFIELEHGYWDADSEQRMRARMKATAPDA